MIKDLLRGVVSYIGQLNQEYLQDLLSAFLHSKKMREVGIALDLEAISIIQELLKIFQNKGQIDIQIH